MKWCIYKHTNKINGKSYIGLTHQEPQKRWGFEGKGYQRNDAYFWNAIQKYGWDNFAHEVLENNISTLKEANEREKYYINLYRTYIGFNDGNGYNLTLGGEGIIGYRHTEKARKNISKNNGRYWKGKHLHPNTVAAQRKYMQEHPECRKRPEGFKMPEESIRKAVEARRKHYELYGNPKKGTHPSLETIEKLRQSHMGQEPWNKGKETPKEVKEKVSKGLLKYYETHTRKGNNFTEDAKKRISESVSKANMGKKFINNGTINKFVTKEEAEEYIKQGWVYGRLSSDKFRQAISNASKGRKWIHKDEEERFVLLEELEDYLNQGYILGPSPKRSQKGNIMLVRGNDFTQIRPEELEHYQKLGWEKSHIFCKKKVIDNA